MVSQSDSRRGGQREPIAESLMDSVGSEGSSVDHEQTSIDGNEDWDSGKMVRISSDELVEKRDEKSMIILSSSNDSAESESRSEGQREPIAESLMDSVGSEDSSVDHEQTSIGGDEDSDSGKMVRMSSDEIVEKRNEKSLISLSLSNDSAESENTRESDSDLSIVYADSGNGLVEDALQMGCMDFVFLPLNAKPKKKKSLFKVNKKGEKELNINVKGPLALGLETKMRSDVEKRGGLKTAMSFGCGNSGGLNGSSSDYKGRHYENKVASDEASTYRSLMSLSHGSSEEEDCDNSVIPENLGLPTMFQQFRNERQPPHMHANLLQQHQQYQGYHQQQYEGQDYHSIYHNHVNQQQMHSYGSNMNGRIPNNSSHHLKGTQSNHQYMKTFQGMPMQSPINTSLMPSQILVGAQSGFEEGNCLSYEANTAPDPPPSSSLSRIAEDDFPEVSSEEGSNSSMVACGSTLSETHENPSFDAPKKKGGKLSKVDRWRKANNQRLKKKKQHGVNSTSTIQEKREEEYSSVDSDQATYSSDSTTVVRDEKGSNSAAIVKDSSTPKNSDSQSLEFDSIFTRRIQKRRAAKLKKNGESSSETMRNSAKLEKNSSDEKPFDIKSDASVEKDELASSTPSSQQNLHNVDENSAKRKSKPASRKGFKNVSENSAATLEMPRNDNMVHAIDSDSSDGIPAPPSGVSDFHSPYESSVIEAVAAAAAFALNKDFQPKQKPCFDNFQPMQKPSFDKDDTENRVPPPIVKGKHATADYVPNKANVLKPDGAVPSKKNPFQDHDDFKDEEELYDDEVHAYPLLTKSSSDHDDVLQPLSQPNTPKVAILSPFRSARKNPSPLFCRNRTIPMTPSPRHSSRPVASPRHHNQWNGSMHSLNSRMADIKLSRCPSGEVKRTDSIGYADSIDESEFFESHMYSN